ncbi:hypothetical protein [Agromyces sp. NPDC057865]|uniref:hypothetical protein n=1 Tax=Agromyces sp. NPDC057865 TaxID=3346267 RepID=UPI003671F764
MSELAHGAMLVGALGAAACVATGRRTALDVAASAAMLAAMTDMAFTRLVPPLAWTGVLAGLGIALGARLRPARGIARSAGRRPHALHRALAFIVGAWSFAAVGGAPSAVPHLGGHLHADAAGGGLAFAAAMVAMTAFGGWLAADELRRWTPERGSRTRAGMRGSARHAAEAASTTVMLAAMAVPGVLAALA